MRRSLRSALGIVSLLLVTLPSFAQNVPALDPRPRVVVPERMWLSFGMGFGRIGPTDSSVVDGGLVLASLSHHGEAGLFTLRAGVAVGPLGSALSDVKAVDLAALYGMSRSWKSASLSAAAGLALTHVVRRVDIEEWERSSLVSLAVNVQLSFKVPVLGIGLGLDLFSSVHPELSYHGLCLAVRFGTF